MERKKEKKEVKGKEEEVAWSLTGQRLHVQKRWNCGWTMTKKCLRNVKRVEKRKLIQFV